MALVDCGDAIQGDIIGMVSQGEYPIEIMDRVGYDFAVPGNHEFDYGVEQLDKLLQSTDMQYLCCNIRYSGFGKSALDSMTSYNIVSYGGTDVAFIGVCTPESITSSAPVYFMDASEHFIYDFYSGENDQELYNRVQEIVDECLDKGADYIILLAHLGDDKASAPFRSIDLIENAEGINVVLDGHSHSVIPSQSIKNKNGHEVLLSSTGSRLNYIGQLIINPNGNITTELISYYPEVDEETRNYIREIQNGIEADMNQIIAHIDTPLSIYSENGIRIVRNRETNIGDFCADAYRTVSGADVAFVNGGGIRANLPAGDITYGNIMDVHPYGNTLCVIQASGQEILDALEMANRCVLPDISSNGNAIGENGGFLQVSGIRFSIDTSIESTVILNDKGMFVSSGDVQRIKDVQVLSENGYYSPLIPSKIYTLASNNYLLRQGGNGFTMFMDNPSTIDEGMPDYQVLITYITDYLDGSVGAEYSPPQERILIE